MTRNTAADITEKNMTAVSMTKNIPAAAAAEAVPDADPTSLRLPDAMQVKSVKHIIEELSTMVPSLILLMTVENRWNLSAVQDCCC